MIAEVMTTILLLWLIWYFISTFEKRRRLPPGPFPFPWFGNIPHLLSHPNDPFNALAQKYGDIYTLFFPVGPTVVVNSASLARETRLKRKDDVSGRSPVSTFPFAELFGDGIVTGDYFPKFKLRKKVFISAVQEYERNVENTETRAKHAVQIALEKIQSMKGEPFPPYGVIKASMLVQVWEWLTAQKVTVDHSAIKLMGEFVRTVSEQSLQATAYQIMPFLRIFSKKLKYDIKRCREIKEQLVQPEFQAHLKTYKSGEIRDLTDSFICSYKKEIANEGNDDLGSIDCIPDMMYDIVFTATDSTSGSVTWVLLYMILYQNVQRKIHDELDSVVGRNRLPNWKDAENMPYMNAVLCEAQRISTITRLTGTNATRDVTISGYCLPKDTYVLLNLDGIHHDLREWPEPFEFKPERFLDGEGKFVGWTKLYGFMPFGLGMRSCPGQSVAKAIVFIFISTLLYFFKFNSPEGAEKPSTEAQPGVVSQPRKFEIIATKRI